MQRLIKKPLDSPPFPSKSVGLCVNPKAFDNGPHHFTHSGEVTRILSFVLFVLFLPSASKNSLLKSGFEPLGRIGGADFAG